MDSQANHLPTLSPKASSASPATSTQHTTDSTAAPPPSASNRSSAAVTDHASDAGDSSFGSTSEKMLDDVSFDVIQGGDPLDEIASPVSSTHPSPKRSPLVAPKDTIKRSQGILIDGHEFVAPGASGVASFLEVVLKDELGSGAGGNVYTDPSGTLAIKVIVPRDADSEEQYEERWDEGVQEVKALKHLEGCAAAPELYGVFVRTDEQGYKWMVIVSERIRGKRCRLGDFKKCVFGRSASSTCLPPLISWLTCFPLADTASKSHAPSCPSTRARSFTTTSDHRTSSSPTTWGSSSSTLAAHCSTRHSSNAIGRCTGLQLARRSRTLSECHPSSSTAIEASEETQAQLWKAPRSLQEVKAAGGRDQQWM